jgi:hypothetical protein
VRPAWRNPSLVSFMFTLGLAQNLGQGLRTIIDETRKIGGKRPTFRLRGDFFEVVLHALRPLLVPSEGTTERPTEQRSGRSGLLLVSIGAPSIRQAVESSLSTLGLEDAEIVVDFSTGYGYLEPASVQWSDTATAIKREILERVEERTYSETAEVEDKEPRR